MAEDPEHGFALALVAMIQLSEVGYGEAREDIERALERIGRFLRSGVGAK